MDDLTWANIIMQWGGPLLVAFGTIILGAIVWGIQLNYAVLKHTGNITSLQKQISDHETESSAHYLQIAKTALILDELEKRMGNLDKEFSTYKEKSENWRHRVVALEARSGVIHNTGPLDER